jgi:hypothetical protein
MGPETQNRQNITFDISISAILKVVAVILALLFLYAISDIVVIFIVSFILAKNGFRAPWRFFWFIWF